MTKICFGYGEFPLVLVHRNAPLGSSGRLCGEGMSVLNKNVSKINLSLESHIKKR